MCFVIVIFSTESVRSNDYYLRPTIEMLRSLKLIAIKNAEDTLCLKLKSDLKRQERNKLGISITDDEA